MTLDEARQHTGDGVVYEPPGGPVEQGVITGISPGDRFVFVRYGADTISKATHPDVLTLLAREVPDE